VYTHTQHAFDQGHR